MKTLHVALGEHAYNIHIGSGLLDRVGEYCRAVLPRAKRLAVVSDSAVAALYAHDLLGALWGAGFEASLVTVPAGESSKSLQELGRLYDAFMDMGLTRSDAVVALGGGVVGDLAGFAAATILRGVSFVQVPTTLLAQVDSSVGGKVAVDLPAGKNLAGAFWQPKLVVMDPECLTTLDDKTFSDGMAEVIKYGCIQDAELFARLEAAPSRAAVMEDIESVLYTCCNRKREVVERDEKDTGERMILNFGHTLGHAYEKAGGYALWTHGQAVAAGMGVAAELGVRLGVTDEALPGRVRALLSAFGLPTRIACDGAGYAAAIGLDKKGAGDDITLVLVRNLGEAVLKRLPKKDVLMMLEDYAE